MSENLMWKQFYTLVVVVGLPIAFVFGIYDFWNRGVDVLSLVLWFVMLVITMFGVTIGFHRLFTHGSFKTHKWVEYVLAICGMMAAQMPVLQWVGVHRKHHAHSDKEGDPHSPHLHGPGFLAALKGAWHSHIGWLFGKTDVRMKWVTDLAKNEVLRKLNRMYLWWILLGLLLPALAAFAIEGTVRAAFLGFLWGGLIRLLAVFHVTWSINSVCHIWGYRSFETSDHSRNNWFIAWISGGEGNHNNHHALPTSARHGLSLLEIDLSWYVIKSMSLSGLAWDVITYTKEEIEERKKSLLARRESITLN